MDFAQRAIDLARQNVAEGGRPFATVIAKDGEILAESANKVAQTHDPTAHAEIRTRRLLRRIRQALGSAAPPNAARTPRGSVGCVPGMVGTQWSQPDGAVTATP
jgi:tRNA(Arg) A34 adenosine deaminase TadA